MIENTVHSAVVFENPVCTLNLIVRHLLEKLLQKLRLLIEGDQGLVKGDKLMQPLKNTFHALVNMGPVRVHGFLELLTVGFKVHNRQVRPGKFLLPIGKIRDGAGSRTGDHTIDPLHHEPVHAPPVIAIHLRHRMFFHGVRPNGVGFIEISRHPVRLLPFYTPDIIFSDTDGALSYRRFGLLENPWKASLCLPVFGIIPVCRCLHKFRYHTKYLLSFLPGIALNICRSRPQSYSGHLCCILI